jgi:hypothetical protein
MARTGTGVHDADELAEVTRDAREADRVANKGAKVHEDHREARKASVLT